MQENGPVAYASRKLTARERQYAQIEKELLAIVCACRKFDQYVFQQEIQVHTDHKPLQTISRKSLAVTPKRLQRMLLSLQRYQIRVIYTPGPKVPVADALSRAPVDEEQSVFEEEQQQVMMSEVTESAISDPTLEEIRKRTARDEGMQGLVVAILEGWPARQEQVSALIQPYFHHRDELTIEDGIIYKGDRCVIPAALRPEMLRKLHGPHMGVEATLRLGRQLVYWPGMSSQLKDRCQRCDTCQSRGRAQQQESLECHEIPQYPWQVVGAGFFSS